ncbi:MULTISPECIES: ABC transporter substrate-binding protein [Cyanophyceae]|uniref:ABC transporter substrate-binding protein n=1 Tax=Cyanophyceae TaxID=3028117 RepID=UPI0016877B94|nr:MULTISPECIES: ABC transporter substrate-binding protein [Cyanophyceae]MBD1916189.1 carbohydrate ABC transporter substrate-binding protein [Phormidium sp. FACHB-77]MBD2031542.1 carbohydrate ABC transporter substrate-binding protein [Phormidium sp. FACHB-322]MBD2052831.1 carbohydrate ABC transporter substrate-binding protein [Leptolyngbya sp. FACHB-60]
MKKLPQFVGLTLTVSVLMLGCRSQSNAPQTTEVRSGDTITILGTLTGVGEDKLRAAMAPFTAATGIEIIYEGSDAFTTLVSVRVDSGNPPDMALFPQPGLMMDFAEAGQMVPLTDFIDRPTLSDAYDEYLLNLVSLENDVYGLWMRADVKSLVWYNPQAFEAKGYIVPETWAEMEALSDRMSADGSKPWCMGMESGQATGWVGTDWVEDILLRQAGPAVYDQWVSHEIPFADPQVKAAFEGFGAIALNPDAVLGGTTGILSTPFGEAPLPLFANPPGCYLHHQASFIVEFLPETIEPGVNLSVFPLPPMDPAQGDAVILGGIVFGVFNDTPAVRALMAYLATPEPHAIWAGLGSYISPHQQVSLDAYPDDLTRKQAEILRDADVLRFDGADLMPGAIGTGAFWSGIVDYVDGQDLDTVLSDIDAAWPPESE